MSNFKVFKHYARYCADHSLTHKYDYNNVSELSFVEKDTAICFTDNETGKTIPMRKEDRYCSIDISKKMYNWPIVYDLIDMDNKDNYLYLYDGKSDRLISKFLILHYYHHTKTNKDYYVVKMEDKFKETLAIFDTDLEGGKYIKRNKVIYYTTGDNKPGVLHKDKYNAYIKSEQDKINAKLKKDEETALKNLTTLDSFLIETGEIIL